jgi:hypothetical protein
MARISSFAVKLILDMSHFARLYLYLWTDRLIAGNRPEGERAWKAPS